MFIKSLKKIKKSIQYKNTLDSLKNLSFKIVKTTPRLIKVRGNLEINSYYETPEIRFDIIGEIFEIEMEVDPYLKTIPTVFEVNGIIPETYHHFKKNNSLCLGSRIELQQLFEEQKNIENFLENCVKPYFFRFACIKKYYKEPWGEYSHSTGILDSYIDLFQTNNKNIVIKLLEKILSRNRNGKCPCGSGEFFRKCHYRIFSEKAGKVPLKVIESDLRKIKKPFKTLKNKKISNLFK